MIKYNIKIIKLIVLFGLMFSFTPAIAQTCGTCSVFIMANDDSSYTVSAGQTFCIDTLGQFTGTLVLNGGTICNRGIFNPTAFTITTGYIYNYGSITIDTNLTLNANIILYCEQRSFLTINGSFQVSGGVYTNNGIATINDSCNFTSGNFSNSGIFNCIGLSGNINTVNNTGIINDN